MYNTLLLISEIKFTAVISAQEYTDTAEFKVNFIITQRTNIAVFIGPEGGFEDEEVELARENGAEIVTLGKRILRTETAGLCMLSALMLQLEV